MKQVKKTDSIEANLVKIGLNKDQAIIYKTLIDLGPSQAHRVAFESGFKRSFVYKLLKQLEDFSLLESSVPRGEKVMIFSPTHPSKLENIVSHRRNEVIIAENALMDSTDELVSQYNLTNKKPNVRFFEGVSGVRKLYEDVLHDGQDVLLLRSFLDQSIPELKELVNKQIQSQVRQKIKTRAITPIHELSASLLIQNDERNLVSRRFLKEKVFGLNSQIMIFGNKVAMTSYKDTLVTTIIDNVDINQSFRVIFELLWNQAEDPSRL